MGTVTAKTHASIYGTYSNPSGIAPAIATVTTDPERTIDSGLNNFQADLLYAASLTLASGATNNLDLSGSLTDPLGAIIAMVEVTAILISSSNSNTTDLTIGAGTNPFIGPFGAAAHTITLKPGSDFLITNPNAGWLVTAATADILKIANGSGATASYTVKILGRSA
jgi:hypothetical protein